MIDSEELVGIGEGDDAELRVGSDGKKLDVKVVSVTPCDDNKKIFIFECDKLNSTVVMGRTARFKLIINSYGGLRVPRKALRYNDNGERGVFVERGQTIVFKKVDVIYWADDYVICRQNVYKKTDGDDAEQQIDEDYLKLYDIIVTEGKDLHDGYFIG